MKCVYLEPHTPIHNICAEHTPIHTCNICAEQHRDKRINRDDEYSDSEDEGDEPPLRARDRRKNEHSFRGDAKRPRLMEETNAKNGATTTTSSGQGGGSSNNQTGKPPAVVTGGGSLSSPLPPEPSPITPLPQEDGVASKNKGTCALIAKLGLR